MLTLILDARHLPEVEAWPDDTAAFRGIVVGAAISAVLSALLFLAWRLA